MPPDFRDEGLRAACAARKEMPELPVLVLSQYVEESYFAELLAGGASGLGYLLKTGSAGWTSSSTRWSGWRPGAPPWTPRSSPNS